MDTLNELKRFYERMTQYEKLVNRWAHNVLPSSATNDEMQDLRTDLQREYPKLEGAITRYGGSLTIADPIFGRKLNIFDVAFGPFDSLNWVGKLNAINDIKTTLNKAIGKLEAEGESWDVPIKKSVPKSKKTKVFISYSGNSLALTDLREYLDELDIEKLIVGKRPNLDRTINVKVEDYLDEAAFVIILATGDSRDRDNNIIPAGNVIHEIGLAQAKPNLRGKIIYLLEEGAVFPSNISAKGYIRFNREKIEHTFGDIVKEIKKMGFLK